MQDTLHTIETINRDIVPVSMDSAYPLIQFFGQFIEFRGTCSDGTLHRYHMFRQSMTSETSEPDFCTIYYARLIYVKAALS